MAVTAAQSSSELRVNYMTLLVEQMKHQDPLEPMNNSEMTAQLATLSQLDQLEMMNGSFAKVLLSQQSVQAACLIGQQITYTPKGATEPAEAIVTGVQVLDGQVWLSLGDGVRVQLGEITSFAPPPEATSGQGQ